MHLCIILFFAVLYDAKMFVMLMLDEKIFFQVTETIPPGLGYTSWLGMAAKTSDYGELYFEWMTGEEVTYTHWGPDEPGMGLQIFDVASFKPIPQKNLTQNRNPPRQTCHKILTVRYKSSLSWQHCWFYENVQLAGLDGVIDSLSLFTFGNARNEDKGKHLHEVTPVNTAKGK